MAKSDSKSERRTASARIEKKCWPEFFQAILDGRKKFEVRLADFAIREGDSLVLREWDPKQKEFTGREMEKKVTYVLKLNNFSCYTPEQIKEFGLQVLSLE